MKVLDSWAVMAYLEDEPGGEAAENIIADSQASGIPLLMSVVNAGEVWYSVASRRSVRDAEKAIFWLREMGVRFVDVDWEITRIAAGYKAKGGLSYADAFAAALAKQKGAHLITGDPEFKRLEKDIRIDWL